MKSRFDSVIAGGLVLAVVFTAAAFGAVETWSISIFELIVALLTAGWFVSWAQCREISVDIPPASIPLFGLVLWGAFQTVKLGFGPGPGGALSLDPGSTRVSVRVFLFMGLAFLLAANTLNTQKRYRVLAVVLPVLALVMAVFALVQNFAWNGAYYWIRPSDVRGFGPFANRDHFAGFMEMLAPIPLSLVLAKWVDRDKRVLYVFATVIPVIAIFASLSRGGILALGVEAAFLSYWFLRIRVRHTGRNAAKTRTEYAAQAAIVLGILGAIAIGVLWVGAEPILNRTAEMVSELQTAQTSFLSRQWIWRDTLSMVRSHPVSGVGLGAFRTVFPAFSHSNGALVVAQAHNDYLQVLADCGIIGALLAAAFVASLIMAIRTALRSRDRLEAGLALGCSAGLIGMLIHSLFDFNLQIPSNGLLFLFLGAVVSAISQGYIRAERDRAMVRAPAKEMVERSVSRSSDF
ncbi:MAG TPA: O-antigen ligase family protein [Blastocatellia bacterium]|nr:O-antigen ligase family protein [Blastocatellia bacterium]